MYRQGDILIVPASETPDEAKPKGDKTIAEGEITGHSHRTTNGQLLEAKGAMFLQTEDATEIVHEEHDEIQLPAGDYRIIRQREYAGEGQIRRVRD